MKENFVVSATPRTAQGKGASRRLRREGLVPGIVYGAGAAAESIVIGHNELRKHLQTEAFYSRILSVRIGEVEQQAVLKDLQRHPVRDEIVHIDLQRVRADQPLRMHVPVHFTGGDVCPGVKTSGGVVEHHQIQLEVECLPKDLPEYIEVDLSQLDIGDSVHLSQLKLPEGVELIDLRHGNDVSVAAVHMPRAVTEVEEVAEGEAAAEVAEETTEAAEAKPETEARSGETKAEDKKADRK